MELLSEYYLWFLVGGIILVMALIGYIADKTDFGRKDVNLNQKQNKEENNNNVSEVTEINTVEEQTLPTEVNETVAIIEEPSIDNIVDNQNLGVVNENNSALDDVDPFVMPSVEEDSSLSNTQDIVSSDNEVNNDEDIEIKEVTDDSIFALNNDLSSFAATELVNPIGSADLVNDNVSEVIGEDILVQQVDNTVNEVETNDLLAEDIDDDIWKF